MGKKDQFQTRAIHVGNEPDHETGAIVAPIHLTSTYEQHAVGKDKGFDYSRGGNPTRKRLEENLASLESKSFKLLISCSGYLSEKFIVNILLLSEPPQEECNIL